MGGTREKANIRLDMWADAEWRKLSVQAQHLYMLLLTHPKTTRAGVCEWHPGRLASMSADTTPQQVQSAANELAARYFVVIDAVTEELVIRSYIKHDGLLAIPNMTVTMANDWAGVASEKLRAVIAFEIQKLRSAVPEMSAWKNGRLQTLLTAQTLNVKESTVGVTQAVTVASTVATELPLPKGLGNATSTSTSTSTASPTDDATQGKKPAIRLPRSWSPTPEHFTRATDAGVDIAAEVESFRNHADTHDRHAANWNAAFTTWLKKSKPSTVPRSKVNAQNEWMYNR